MMQVIPRLFSSVWCDRSDLTGDFNYHVFLKLPEIKEEESETDESGEKKTYKSSAFKYAHVWLGSLAIFFYMGIEVGIPSFFGRLFRQVGIQFFVPGKN